MVMAWTLWRQHGMMWRWWEGAGLCPSVKSPFQSTAVERWQQKSTQDSAASLPCAFISCLCLLGKKRWKKNKYIIWIKIFNKMHFICCLFQVLSFISQAIYLLLSIVGPSQYSHLQYLRVFIAKCLLRPSSRESLSEFTGMWQGHPIIVPYMVQWSSDDLL